MEEKKDVLILGIESSCDETAACCCEKRKNGFVQCYFLSD